MAVKVMTYFNFQCYSLLLACLDFWVGMELSRRKRYGKVYETLDLKL